MNAKLLILTALLMAHSVLAQMTPTEIAVTLKTSDGTFVGQVANGGLDATATTVSPKTTFTLVDMNGAKVADGDVVKLKFESTEWAEEKASAAIKRLPSRIAKPEETLFKIRVQDKLIVLETPSGKFVKVADGALTTTAEIKDATRFDIQAASATPTMTSYLVAFRFGSGNLIGMVANGGLDATSKEITPKQVFTLVDLNGGPLNGGDSVKLVFGESLMREDAAAGKIHRVAIRGAVDSECTFKLVLVGGNVLLQAPSGRYVAASEDFKSLVTTDKRDASSLLTALPAPTVAKPVN